MHCPHCGKNIQDGILKSYVLGLAGQAGTGEAKARSHEQASKAGKAGALKRWANHKKAAPRRQKPPVQI